jgi:hypothetical protein
MTEDFKTQLKRVQQQYCLDAGGGVALPVAGAVYWIVLAALGTRMEAADWAPMAAMLSGAIFPLGILLQKPLGSPFMKSKSPLSGVTMLAIIAINALWPIHFIVFGAAPHAAPLTLAIGMTLHWPIIGWTYGSRVCQIHAAARILVVTALWFALPNGRLTVLPLAVAALYLMAAAGMRWEVVRLRRRSAQGLAGLSGQAA